MKIIAEKDGLSTKIKLDIWDISGKLFIMTNEWPNRFRNYLKVTRMTQKQLSSALGVNPSTLNRWIKGENTPSALWQKHLNKVLVIEN